MENLSKLTIATVFAFGLANIPSSPLKAATVTYDISGQITTGEASLIDEAYTGTVTFDEDTNDVTSVIFNILGSTFDETDADITPTVAFDGDLFLGLDYTVTVGDPSFDLEEFTLSTGFDPSDALFDYNPRVGIAGTGDVTYTLAVVPEPSSLTALIGLGIFGIFGLIQGKT